MKPRPVDTDENLPPRGPSANGAGDPEPSPAPVPSVALTGARIQLDLASELEGRIYGPRQLTANIPFADEGGNPVAGFDLRRALHEAVDQSVDHYDLMRRGEA